MKRDIFTLSLDLGEDASCSGETLPAAAPSPAAPPARNWTVCGDAEPPVPGWYETQTFHRSGPAEWRQADGYDYFTSVTWWNGTQWRWDDVTEHANPIGTTYLGDRRDRWRDAPAGFDPTPIKQRRGVA